MENQPVGQADRPTNKANIKQADQKTGMPTKEADKPTSHRHGAADRQANKEADMTTSNRQDCRQEGQQ